MPPIIGTAMRCMSSEPVPWLHRIGSNPAMIAVTVIIFGRTRSTAPSMMAARRSSRSQLFDHPIGGQFAALGPLGLGLFDPEPIIGRPNR
jgi:hypothetical protein